MTHGQRIAGALGLGLGLGLWLGAEPASALTVTLAPSKDNTLYEDGTGGISNGAGEFLFVGRAGSLRRGIMAFDVAGAVPAGATILAATLRVHCSRTPFFAPPATTIALHKVLANWGEGASDAGTPGGTGAASAPGDATWIHTFYNTTFWANPGGDFTAASSGGVSVADTTFYALGTTQMAADAQSWLDSPATNYGWILVGVESAQNSRRFDTRENHLSACRPALTLEYVVGTVAVANRTWAVVKGLYR